MRYKIYDASAFHGKTGVGTTVITDQSHPLLNGCMPISHHDRGWRKELNNRLSIGRHNHINSRGINTIVLDPEFLMSPINQFNSTIEPEILNYNVIQLGNLIKRTQENNPLANVGVFNCLPSQCWWYIDPAQRRNWLARTNSYFTKLCDIAIPDALFAQFYVFKTNAYGGLDTEDNRKQQWIECVNGYLAWANKYAIGMPIFGFVQHTTHPSAQKDGYISPEFFEFQLKYLADNKINPVWWSNWSEVRQAMWTFQEVQPYLDVINRLTGIVIDV